MQETAKHQAPGRGALITLFALLVMAAGSAIAIPAGAVRDDWNRGDRLCITTTPNDSTWVFILDDFDTFEAECRDFGHRGKGNYTDYENCYLGANTSVCDMAIANGRGVITFEDLNDATENSDCVLSDPDHHGYKYTMTASCITQIDASDIPGGEGRRAVDSRSEWNIQDMICVNTALADEDKIYLFMMDDGVAEFNGVNCSDFGRSQVGAFEYFDDCGSQELLCDSLGDSGMQVITSAAVRAAGGNTQCVISDEPRFGFEYTATWVGDCLRTVSSLPS